MFNCDQRVFRGKVNSANGEVSGATLFFYRQQGEQIWADYRGGEIVSGHLQGKVFADGRLVFVYHHQNLAGELQAGRCESTPQLDETGRLLLHERWQWFTGDQSSGQSEIEELTAAEREHLPADAC